MKFGLEENIIENLIKTFEANPKVYKAIVFGSRAKGSYRPNSDIDIAIKGYDITLDDILKMSVAFDDKKIIQKIDLIDYTSIKEPALKEHIDRVGIEFYSRWKELKLEDILQLGNGKERPKIEGDIPVFGGNGILGYCDQSNYKDETLIIGRVGAYCGSVFYQNKPIWVSDNALSAKPKKDFHAKFLFYFLKNLGLNNFAQGSSHPLVTQTLLNSIEVSILDNYNEQKIIASLLSGIDDKIDLLYRQNKTLEQLAETLFRKWFVEESEESWEEITLLDVSDHLKENIQPSKNLSKLYKHYSLPAFDEGREPVIEIGKEILSNKYKVVSNSILVSKLNPRTPRIWMLYENINEYECICSTEFQVVKPKDIKWFGFIYCFLKSNHVTQELAGASGGTSGSHQRVKPEDIFNLTLLKPNEELVEEFDRITKDYWIKITRNLNQIRSLTQLRDTLLPKLMSGEVRVKMN